MYYVICLTHTMPKNKFVTIWRENNAGYCWSKSNAGVYKEIEPGYHDSDLNIPMPVSDAEKLFTTVPYDGKMQEMILNCKAIWDILNVRMTRDGLVKRKRSPRLLKVEN